MIFEKITIIGFGLIGSSLARAIRHYNLAKTIIAADQNQSVCDTVNELSLADKATTDIAGSVKGADLVIISVPVGAYTQVIEAIKVNLKEGALVTDTGSVKQSVIQKISSHMPGHAVFVPGHPIAGTEYSGPENGFKELFIDRWTILTPLPDTPVQELEKITKLWEGCGATVEIMSPEHHDLTLAITSHLPHLIAYTIVGTATELEGDLKRDVINLSASGFRDFTRIAASDPVMWRDVFVNNRDSVLEVLSRFSEDLSEMQRAIRKGDAAFLEEKFTKTRAIRREIIDAGQHVEETAKAKLSSEAG